MSIQPNTPCSARLHRLRRHRFLTLHRPHGVCLRAERGTLWVTIDGDRRDIELEAGQRMVFTGRAPVVVGTIGGDAVLSITPSVAASPWRTWRKWLPGTLRRAAGAVDLTLAAAR